MRGRRAVVQLYADGFDDLALREKTLVYHLYQAAIAGRDIYYDQRYEHNLEMRDVLEEIVTHASGIDEATLPEIWRFTKLFWINTGPYNNLTARKFVLKVSPDTFAEAAGRAAANGARFPVRAGESLHDLLRLERASSTSNSIPSSPARRQAPAATSCRRAPITCIRASRWRTSRRSRSNTRSTRGS